MAFKDERLRKIQAIRDRKDVEASERIDDLIDLNEVMVRKQIDHEQDMEPVYEFYRTANNTKKGFVWLAGFLAAVGSVVYFFTHLK